MFAVPTPLLAYDFTEWHVVDAAEAKQAGYSAGIGYCSLDPSKNLTPGEAGTLHMASLGVGLVWETTADRALGGVAAGSSDAGAFGAQLRALGVPGGSAVWVNIGDFKAAADELATIHAYYEAVKGGLGGYGPGLGGYGTAFIIDGLVALGSTGLWWQNAMDDGGEAGSVVSPHAWLYQRVTPTLSIPGASYDENVVVNGHTLPWWTAAPQPIPPPPPPPPAPPAPPQAGPDGNPFTAPPGLATDGIFGLRSTQATQWKDGSPADGIFGVHSRADMQRRLANLGLYSGAIDSILGPGSVRALQQRVGAPVDGSWGPVTTTHLQAALNRGAY